MSAWSWAIVAAALTVLAAWLMHARQEQELQASTEDARVSPLLRGINYLLSDQPDRALQELVQVARLGSETAEVYMALGEMFRARGEYGRAVRIHQNLLARPDLPESLRLQAHYALAVDFQTGGLLDRALRQYRKLLDLVPDHVPALEACLRIREQSREWLEAEALLTRLEQVQHASFHQHRAYLFAQEALQALEDGRDDEALHYADRALTLMPTCAPAHLVRFELALRRQDHDAADAVLRTMAERSPEHVPLLIPMMMRWTAYYRARGADRLRELWRQNQDEELALGWLEALGEQDRQAAEQLRRELDFQPENLRARLRLEAVFEQDGDRSFARAWRRQVTNYRCTRCGVGVKEMRWQCPQCHAWGSMHPQKGEIA